MPAAERCESCGAPVVFAYGQWVELWHDDGRTQAMPVHTPDRCRELRDTT